MKLINLILILFPIFFVALANRNGRIRGGANAERGLFPWHVKIEAFDGRAVHICGGALIRNNYVLTTAVCIRDSVDIILRFGTINRLEGPVSSIYRITQREHVIIHPNYNPTLFSSDLALLYLEGSETLLEDQYVDIIELPTEEDYPANPIGLSGNITGFGIMNDDDPPLLSMHLQYVELPIISNETCSQAHGGLVDFNDKFCLDGATGSTCIGDEGAPFVVYSNERRVLGGIGSVALGNCAAGIPSIFTSLMPYLDWINDIISDPPVVTPPEPDDRCNCVCRCYTCPAPEPAGRSNFQKRWLED